jgi:predicted class III extradiol MEMO1 family dioxygenase
MQHKEMLSTGQFFVKKSSSMGGLMKSEDRVRVCLSSDGKNLEWQIVSLAGAPKAGSRYKGFVELKVMKQVDPIGATTMQIIGPKHKAVLELEAEEGQSSTRDEWITALNDTIKQLAPEVAKEEANKVEQMRRADKQLELNKKKAQLKKNKKDADARKAKYGGAGMKYTAEAMARNALTPTSSVSGI